VERAGIEPATSSLQSAGRTAWLSVSAQQSQNRSAPTRSIRDVTGAQLARVLQTVFTWAIGCTQTRLGRLACPFERDGGTVIVVAKFGGGHSRDGDCQAHWLRAFALCRVRSGARRSTRRCSATSALESSTSERRARWSSRQGSRVGLTLAVEDVRRSSRSCQPGTATLPARSMGFNPHLRRDRLRRPVRADTRRCA